MAYPSPRRLQLRRGNTSAVSAYLGSAGELVVNTDNWTLYVHDGVTVGGYAATVNTASITSNINSITNGTAVFGNLIPSANVTYSLGNVTHQWNDLYVSNNTIYVGGVPLSIDNTGNLTVNGNTIPTVAYVNTAVANVVVDLSSYALNANVTAANVGMKGYVDQANTIQSVQLTSANLGIIGYINQGNTIQSAQITAANIGMRGYVDAQTYTNVNVTSYFLNGTPKTFAGNLTIEGNLFVNGNVNYISVNNIAIGDNIINLADLNPADSLDLGLTAHRTVNGILQHTGLIRDASANQWRLFSNVPQDVGTTVDFTDAIYDDLQLGNITSPTITAINNNIAATNAAWAFANTIQSQQVAAANVGIIGYINQANTIQSAQISAANIGIIGYVDNAVSTANVGIIGYINQGNTIQAAAITAANVGIKGYVDFANTAMKAYVDGQIIAANANVSSSSGTNYSNVNVAAYLSTATINTTGNITAAYISGNISVTGNVTGTSPNVTLQAGAFTSVFDNQGNVTVPQLFTSGNIQTAGYLFGNGAFLTGVVTSGGSNYSNVDVANYLPTYAGTVSASLVNTAGNILATGLSVFGNTRIGLAGAVSGQFHSVVGNITQTSSGGAVYFNTTGNVLAAAVVAGAVTSTGTVAVNAATGITTNQTTFLLANATATTINIGGAATTIRMGTNTSNVWVGRAVGNQNRELLIRAQGTWNTAINIDSNGGFNSPPYANQPVIGGSGTGMTANYSSTGGYLTTLTIYNPGTGYRSGDVISVPGGIAGNSFTLTNYSSTLTGNSSAAYTFGIEGNLTVPGNVIATRFIGDGSLLTGISSGGSNYSNVNVQAYTETMGFANYSNVNVAAYLNTQGYNLYSNANVASYLPTYSGNIANIRLGVSGVLTFSDGTTMITASAGGGSSYSNVNVAAYLTTYGGAIQSSNVQTTTANIQATTAATNPATGALRVMGGVGVAGTVFAGQLNTTGNLIANAVSAYSLNTVANVTASVVNAGTINSTGNVLAQNLTGTLTTASQTNITQVGTLATLSVTGNATVGNLVGNEANTRIIANTYVTTFDIYGNVSFPGNVIAPYFIGDGSQLTGIVSGGGSSYGNSNVAQYLPTYSGNIANIRLGSSGVLTFADGTTQITAGGGSYSNVQVATYLPTYQGNIVAANVWTTGNATGSGALTVGPAGYTALPTTITQFTGNANTYTQLNIQNISTGSDATAEYVATANNGTDTTFFVDMGIANSNYDVNSPANSLGTTIYPNDSYLYAQGNLATTTGGNLAIGTSTAGKSVKIFAGGINSANIVATVSNTGVAVTGNVSATGNITASGYIVTAGGFGNISQVDYITANNVVATANVTVQGMGVTMPNRPAFRVNGTTQNIPQTITANVNLKGLAISTAYNQGNYFDAATGKFTAPIAGIYSVGLNARVGTFNGLSQIAVLKNGTNTAGNVVCFWETDTNAGTAMHFGVNGTVVLAVGDYLAANILAGNITFDQNDNWHVTYLG